MIEPSFRRPLPRAHLIDREGSRRWWPVPIAVNIVVAIGWVVALPAPREISRATMLPLVENFIPRVLHETACGDPRAPDPDPIVILLGVDGTIELLDGALVDASNTNVVYLDVESAVTVGAWVRGLDAIRRSVPSDTRIVMIDGEQRDEWRHYRAAGL